MPVLPFAFSPWMIAAFIVWTVGGALILIDFYRLRQKRQRGEPSSWYASPLLWFSACAFPIGLMVAMISASSFFYGFSGYWLIAAFILMLLFLAGGLIAVVRWDVQQVALQQEERLRQLAASNPWTIAASRPIANLAMTGMVIIGFFVAFFASMSILSFYTLLFPNSMWWMILSTVLLIALLILLAGSIALSSVQKRFYKRLNIRKSLLAAENSYLTPLKLAVQEPLQTLMPPLALYLKRIIIACYLVLVAAYVLLLLHFTDALTITSTIFQLLIYLPFWLFYLLRGWREQVEATTQTLTVTRGIWFARQKQHIPWQEARLFICYASFSFLKRKTTMIYKLVGSSRLVQWTRVVNTRSLFIPWRTELPDDEYNRQTRELCVSITRLTGLQLRDLSEEEQGPDARRQEMLIQSQLHR